jgi:hypothetical protein
MIFDVFMFHREFELLKLRCEELKPLGVTHILVESDHTHQGQPKPLYFEQQKHLFTDYNIQHTVYRADPSLGPWANERAQRDFAWDDSIKDGDILILTDADEIPRADTVRRWIVGLVDGDLTRPHFAPAWKCAATSISLIANPMPNRGRLAASCPAPTPKERA